MHSPCSLIPLLLVGAGLARAEVEAEQLRYKFTEGTTNAYRITLESPSPNNPMRFEGFVVVGVRAVDEGVATVSFRGRIQLKPPERGGPMAPGPQLPPRGRFGPPRIEPWRIMNLTPLNEAQVDSSGRILRIAGLQDLPRPLQTYADIFFQPLPGDLTKPVETEEATTLDEDASGRQRPRAIYPGGPGGGPGRLTGIRKERIEVAEKTEGLVRLNRTMEFQSHLKTEDQPRLAFSSRSELVFDAAAGTLKSAKIEGSSSVATLEVLQRLSLNVGVERLEGEELAKAIAETADRPAVITEVDVDKLVADLQGEDQPKRIEAAQRLLNTDIERHATRLLPVLLPLLDENEPILRMVAVRLLGRAATQEHLPLLHRLLKQQDFGQQHEIIQALGRIRDKSSIQLLADMIAYGTGNSHAAAEALGEFGSVVEDAALSLLKEKHIQTRQQACQILRKVGTTRSIEALQALIAAEDPQFIPEATETVRAIRQRGEEAEKLVF